MKPTKAQERAEKRLRDMGVTFSYAYPHLCDPPDPRCFRCQMKASSDRVNGADS